MIERGHGAGLALEAAHALLVLGEARGKELQRDLALEDFILGEIDLAHTSGADQPADPVSRDRRRLHGWTEHSRCTGTQVHRSTGDHRCLSVHL